MRTILITPEKNELNYRKEILSKKRNTAFTHQVFHFNESDYDSFYQEWINADPKERMYRYLYCDECGYPVGEAFYQFNHNKNRYELMILVEYDAREEGYGTEGLALMEEEGRKHQIDSYTCFSLPDNAKAVSFLQHHGFVQQDKEGEFLVYKKAI